MDKRVDVATRPARQFLTGVGLFGRGLAWYGRNPRLVLLGLLPALIAFALLVTGFGVLLYFIGDLAALVTWFADGWSAGLRGTLRVLAGIALIGLALLLSIVLYTALTLAIGDPFYEKIAERVDEQLGGVPGEVDRPWWRELGRGIGESLRLIGFSVLVGLPLFVAGFLPAVGQTVVPVLAALVGGWALALELTGVGFARRGLFLRERRLALRQHRFLALGFGVAVFVVFLIPLGAVLAMPGAVAGATLLTRRIRGETDRPVPLSPSAG